MNKNKTPNRLGADLIGPERNHRRLISQFQPDPKEYFNNDLSETDSESMSSNNEMEEEEK